MGEGGEGFGEELVAWATRHMAPNEVLACHKASDQTCEQACALSILHALQHKGRTCRTAVTVLPQSGHERSQDKMGTEFQNIEGSIQGILIYIHEECNVNRQRGEGGGKMAATYFFIWLLSAGHKPANRNPP